MKVLTAQEEYIIQEVHSNKQCEEILKLREEQVQILREELKKKEEQSKVNTQIMSAGLVSFIQFV